MADRMEHKGITLDILPWRTFKDCLSQLSKGFGMPN
jgi:hypothetical protein